MSWDPYTDQKNRAYSNILTSLFPEQTKTLPRILIWSIVFLADLILCIGAAAYFGLMRFGQYRSSNEMTLTVGLLLAVTVGIFWLQGKLWYGFINFLRDRNRLD